MQTNYPIQVYFYDKRITPVKYGEIFKSELRQSDYRCATCVENIFFKTKKLRMKIYLDRHKLLCISALQIKDQ